VTEKRADPIQTERNVERCNEEKKGVEPRDGRKRGPSNPARLRMQRRMDREPYRRKNRERVRIKEVKQHNHIRSVSDGVEGVKKKMQVGEGDAGMFFGQLKETKREAKK